MVVDFPRERDTFRNKIMEIVEDFDEKSYNKNGKPWKSSRILRLNPIFSLFFLFSSFFLRFLHVSSLKKHHFCVFSSCFTFLHFLNVSSFVSLFDLIFRYFYIFSFFSVFHLFMFVLFFFLLFVA